MRIDGRELEGWTEGETDEEVVWMRDGDYWVEMRTGDCVENGRNASEEKEQGGIGKGTREWRNERE